MIHQVVDNSRRYFERRVVADCTSSTIVPGPDIWILGGSLPAVSANAYYRPASASRGLGPVVRGRVRTGPPRRAYDDGSKV